MPEPVPTAVETAVMLAAVLVMAVVAAIHLDWLRTLAHWLGYRKEDPVKPEEQEDIDGVDRDADQYAEMADIYREAEMDRQMGRDPWD